MMENTKLYVNVCVRMTIHHQCVIYEIMKIEVIKLFKISQYKDPTLFLREGILYSILVRQSWI